MRATLKPLTFSVQRIVEYSKLNTFVPGHPQAVSVGLNGEATSWSRILTSVLVRIDPAVGAAISCDSSGSCNGLEIVTESTRFTSLRGGGKGRKNSSGMKN